MKQLKCIINDYSTVGNGGFININFNQNITLQPYSSIALDKISTVILPNPSGTIILEADQTINIITQNIGSRISPKRSVILPRGYYSYNETAPYIPGASGVAIPDLVVTLNKLFNGILNGTPNLSVATNNELDYGLGFKWVGAVNTSAPPVYQLTLNVYQDRYAGATTAMAPFSNTPLFDKSNVTTGGLNGFNSIADGAFYVRDPIPIISGCFQGSVNIQLPNTGLASVINYGLCLATTPNTLPVIVYGMSFEGNYAYVINNGSRTTQLPISYFRAASPTATVNMYMYTDSTTGNLRFMVTNPDLSEPFKTDINTYTGYNTNTPYFMACNGNHASSDTAIKFLSWRAFHQPNISFDNDGIFFSEINTKLYLTNASSLSTHGLDVPVNSPNRQIQIDLSDSLILINSLGLSLNILQGNVSETTPFSYTGTKGVNFNSYFDLGLDILNLSLETYVGFSNGKGSGKKNCLAYFLMQRISDLDSLFYSEQKQMIFLSLENKSTMNISSLQFRIYDVNTNLPVNLTNGSFNLYIADKSDGGDHDKYPATRYMGAVHEVAQF